MSGDRGCGGCGWIRLDWDVSNLVRMSASFRTSRDVNPVLVILGAVNNPARGFLSWPGSPGMYQCQAPSISVDE